MFHIEQLSSTEHLPAVKALIGEYLAWLTAQIATATQERAAVLESHDYGSDEAVLALLMECLDPGNCLLVAWDGDQPIACVGLRRLEDSIAEVRSLFVLPGYRGMGLARTLIEWLLAKARATGYARVRLETAEFMGAAVKLYTRLGFKRITPYAPVPAALQATVIPMELVFSQPPRYTRPMFARAQLRRTAELIAQR